MAPRVFDETVLPHMDAAFNYARWLTRNDAEAEDVVQDACMRAMRYFSSLRGDDARAWLFAIVRNTWYSRVSRRASVTEAASLDSDEHPDEALDPEARLLQQRTVERVRAASEQLPVDFREVIVLREIEGLSYKEIAAVVRAPGIVAKRAARRAAVRVFTASNGPGPTTRRMRGVSRRFLGYVASRASRDQLRASERQACGRFREPGRPT
jgi:RNA polymerase sigma factor (sigma-70 family)